MMDSTRETSVGTVLPVSRNQANLTFFAVRSSRAKLDPACQVVETGLAHLPRVDFRAIGGIYRFLESRFAPERTVFSGPIWPYFPDRSPRTSKRHRYPGFGHMKTRGDTPLLGDPHLPDLSLFQILDRKEEIRPDDPLGHEPFFSSAFPAKKNYPTIPPLLSNTGDLVFQEGLAPCDILPDVETGFAPVLRPKVDAVLDGHGVVRFG